MGGDKTIAVLGAGIAGLTAAHELLERGFSVTIFDKRDVREWGGRARSYAGRMRSATDGTETKTTVPAEHGFHFFPGFYRHVDDTLKRIPAGAGSLFSNLVPASVDLLAVTGKPRIKVPTSAPERPHLLDALRLFLQFPKDLTEVGLTKDDLSIFTGKLWQIASSSPERRNEEYERIDWRSFVESLDRSEEYYWYLASGITRTLVAARARQASTKTMGNIALQLLLCLAERGNTMDRVLNGPTNAAWIRPWLRYLREKWPESKLTMKALEIERIEVEKRSVDGRLVVKRVWGGGKKHGPFDYVMCALPVETVVALARAEANSTFKMAGGETLERMGTLADQNLSVMAGMQIYLKKDVDICHGHQIVLDSEWGLTSISQRQFWTEEHRRALQECGIGGIVSVDISSWDRKTADGGPSPMSLAADGQGFQIFKEVLRQLKSGLGDFGPSGNVAGWYLEEQAERILVNATGTWKLRPTTRCGQLSNLFLAGDYVQTKTDLACMEGANESARHAVNAILAAEKRRDLCEVFDPFDREPSWLKVFQQADQQRYRRGLPWSGVDLSELVVSADWALDTVGDVLLLDDKRDVSLLPPAYPGAPFRLPREEWDPSLLSGMLPAATGAPAAAATGTLAAAATVQAAAEVARPLRDDEVEELLRGTDASPGRKDPMFRQWRLHLLEDGDTAYYIPFHVYDGDALVIHGQARNLKGLQDLTRGTGYFPAIGRVSSTDSKFGSVGDEYGYAELWVVDYRDTIAGAYKELVLNFVVNKVENHRKYRWRSPYSSIVPMMEPTNRLFTPLLLVDQGGKPPALEGAVRYGNELFGTNKIKAKIEIQRKTDGSAERFSWQQLANAGDEGKGDCPEFDDPIQDVADYVELSREMGVVEVVKNARQAFNGEELQGGLITRDQRSKDPLKRPVVDIRAAYKFAPKMRVLSDGAIVNPKRSHTPTLDEARSDLSALLTFIDFHPTIATYDHHLKSVLYLDGWPTPDGPPIP